jgi:hypothetical protein
MSNPNNEALALNDLLVIAEDVDDPWGRVNENFQRIMQWTDLLVARNPRIEWLGGSAIPQSTPSLTSGAWTTYDLAASAPTHATGCIASAIWTFAAEEHVNCRWRENSSISTPHRSIRANGTAVSVMQLFNFGSGTKSFDVVFDSTSGNAAASSAMRVYAWIF